MVTAAGRTTVSHVLARCLLHLAREAESHDETRLARTRFLAAIRHDPSPVARLEFARFLADSGEAESALQSLEDALQLAKGRQCSAEIADCCRRLATFLHDRANPARASQFAQQAAAAEMSGWEADEASFSCEQLLLESKLAAGNDDLRRAFQLGKAALKVSQEHQRSAVLRQLARLTIAADMRPEATHLLLAAARSARRAEDDHSYGRCLLELGDLLRSMSRGALAIRCYDTAARRFTRGGHKKLATLARRSARETAAIERTTRSPHCN